MGRTIDGSRHRAGINEKPKDKWWFDESGLTERQVIWLLSIPACAEMNRAMLELTHVSYSTGEQNKDMMMSRQARDMKDTWTLLLASAERNPFTTHTDLINIMTGVHAESSVNVEMAREVGQSILDSMTGKSVPSHPSKLMGRRFR